MVTVDYKQQKTPIDFEGNDNLPFILLFDYLLPRSFNIWKEHFWTVENGGLIY